jgi:hypothetical protein
MALRARALSTCLCLSFLFGCLQSSRAFDPQKIPFRHGPIAGHIEVRRNGDSITGSCEARFFDQKKLHSFPLPKDGWLFGSLPLGRQQFAGVQCQLGREVLSLNPQGPAMLQVDGNGAITYFGHLFFAVEQRTFASRFSGTFTADPEVRFESQLDDTKREYQARFGAAGEVLTFAGQQPAASHVVEERVLVGAVQLTFSGEPSKDARQISIRFSHHIENTKVLGCKQLSIKVDGSVRDFPVLAYKAASASAKTPESVMVRVDYEAVQAMGTAHETELTLCEAHAVFDLAAIEAVRVFADRFGERLAAR